MSELRSELLVPPADDLTLTRTILAPIFDPRGRGWWALLALCLLLDGVLAFAVGETLFRGIGTWGNNIPVGWAFGITNFVWWIGIGHAGTLISAILLLFQQRWRTSINRFAEAMTLFAVMCAGMFPLLHLGRPWFFYWLLPYPNTMRLWPQFKSPLVWDVFAVSTYLIVSFVFWYLGLIPDLAAARDAAPTERRRKLYGIFALGWRGSARHWHHFRVGYLLLAGLATPLVLSVHTVVSFDFAVGIVPGWHTTIFPPYFVAGAVYSGFAMVVMLMIPARVALGLTNVVTLRHIENMNKVLLATGCMVGYGYLIEHFVAWYSGDRFERALFDFRATGSFAIVYWGMLVFNVLVPQVMWFRRARRSLVISFIASLLIQIGMWSERFIIVVTSLSHEFMPSKWEAYHPTVVDFGLLFGTMGFFGTCFLLFLRFVPAVAIHEVKELRVELLHEQEEGVLLVPSGARP